MTLWTSAEAQAATLGRASAPFAANGLSIDTRTLKPGGLFVALKGDNRDGHDFVQAAFAAGAAAALVSRAPAGVDGPLLHVAHTQRGLEDLARAARARSTAKILAVTGSAGKTTTKEMLRLCCDALGRTHASAASYNNHWGVPLSLAGLPHNAGFGIFEIGMNHFGEIRNLVSLVRPDVALVTTIAPAHLEFFGSCDAIADAKSEIFEGLLAGGAALIPADSPYADRLAARAEQAHARVVRFGSTGEARLLAWAPADPKQGAAEAMRIKADIFGRIIDCVIGAPGAHIAQNAVAALAAVALVDGDVLNAAAALKSFTALKGRGARFEAGDIHVIDESYNANPASMAAALALLGAKKTRRIAVLGDMLEMGEGGLAHHAGLAVPIEAARVDLVFAAGDQMKALWDVLPASRRGAYAENSRQLVPLLLTALRPGDTVLVKGSFGSRMAAIIDALKGRAA
jgi:UDP-N-acetylmuramoyl-tripeptide--D-alanyl-D-alanine ligase